MGAKNRSSCSFLHLTTPGKAKGKDREEKGAAGSRCEIELGEGDRLIQAHEKMESRGKDGGEVKTVDEVIAKSASQHIPGPKPNGSRQKSRKGKPPGHLGAADYHLN